MTLFNYTTLNVTDTSSTAYVEAAYLSVSNPFSLYRRTSRYLLVPCFRAFTGEV